MATSAVTLNREQLSGLLTNDTGLQDWVETVLNQILAAQVTEQSGAHPYERSATRKAYRTGSRPRPLTTRVGPLVLPVPQLRDGRVSPPLFPRYQRSEPALL
jgi:transposase-like protein